MHRVVDAMNVIGSRPDGWWRDRPAAIARLASQLEHWAAASGERVTMVLERRPREPLAVELVAVEWASEPGRDAADREIVRRLGEWVGEDEVTVVTSDRDLAARASAAGAAVEPSSRFRARIESL